MVRFCNCCFFIWKFYIFILMKENFLKGKLIIIILNLEFWWFNGFLVEYIVYLLKFNIIKLCFFCYKFFKERKCEINVWNLKRILYEMFNYYMIYKKKKILYLNCIIVIYVC